MPERNSGGTTGEETEFPVFECPECEFQAKTSELQDAGGFCPKCRWDPVSDGSDLNDGTENERRVTETVTLRMPPDLLEAVDAEGDTSPYKIPRSEVIRTILREQLLESKTNNDE